MGRITNLLWAAALVLDAGAQTLQREVAPFPMRDATGEVLETPFLGGFLQPRPQLVDLNGDAQPELLLQQHTGRISLFIQENGRWVWRTDQWNGLDAGLWLIASRDLVLTGDADGRVWAYPAADSSRRTGPLRDESGAFLYLDPQNQPTWGDLTGNGWRDLVLAETDGTLTVYEGRPPVNGIPQFAPPQFRYQDLQMIGSVAAKTATSNRHGSSALALLHLDGGARPSLLWGDFFSPSLYRLDWQENQLVVKTSRFPTPQFVSAGWNLVTADASRNPACPDLVVGVVGGAFSATSALVDNLHAFSCTAPGVWEARTTRLLPTLDVGAGAVPAVADLNGDGRPELLVAAEVSPETASGALHVWRDASGSGNPDWQPVSLSGVETLRFGLTVAATDLDGDGLQDLLLGGFDGRIAFFRNLGNWTFERLGTELVLPRAQLTAVAATDLNGDGLPDLVVGDLNGVLTALRNTGTRAMPQFTDVQASLPRLGRKARPAFAPNRTLLIGTDEGDVWLLPYEGPFQWGAPRRVLRDVPGAAPAYWARPDPHPALFVGTRRGGLEFYHLLPTRIDPDPAATGRILGLFPHPATEETQLKMALDRPAAVFSCLYDLLGRDAGCTSPQTLPEGEHDLELPRRPHPAVWLVRLFVHGQPVASVKLVQGR